jgi:hypothetical protein
MVSELRLQERHPLGGESNMAQKNQVLAAQAVERRSEPRFETSQTVLLRTQNTHPIEACVLDVSSRGVRLRASAPIPVGASVRVDAQELLLFGTTTRCEPTDRGYNVGISLSRPLEMLDELRKLNASLLAEPF